MQNFAFKQIPKIELPDKQTNHKSYIVENLSLLNKLASEQDFVVFNSRFLPDVRTAYNFELYSSCSELFKYSGKQIKQGSRLMFLTTPKIDLLHPRVSGLLEITYLAYVLEQMELDNSNVVCTTLGERKFNSAEWIARRIKNKLAPDTLKRLALMNCAHHDLNEIIEIERELFLLTNHHIPIVVNFDLLNDNDHYDWLYIMNTWEENGEQITQGGE